AAGYGSNGRSHFRRAARASTCGGASGAARAAARRDADSRGVSGAALGALALRLAGRVGTVEHVPVLGDEALALRGAVFRGGGRRHGAFGLARAAVDALIRVDVQHVLALINAIHGTHVHAGPVLHVDAGFRDDVGQIGRAHV